MWAPIEWPASTTGPVAHLGVEHRLQVGRQLGVRVAAVRRGGIGPPVAARVVGDLAIPAPSEDLRAMDHVAAGGGDAVEQRDRRAVPDRLTGQPLILPLDRELRRLDGVRHDRRFAQAAASARAR